MRKSTILRAFSNLPLFSYQTFWFSLHVLLAAAIERLYDLNVGATPVHHWQVSTIIEEEMAGEDVTLVEYQS